MKVTQPNPPPTLVVDSREQDPLPLGCPFIREGLQTGDYSIAGAEHLFAVERKSIPDLVACCTGDNRERFERELHRLRGYHFKRLLVVGVPAEVEMHRYRSSVSPASVLGSLAAWEVRFDCPVCWAATPEAGARLVERWAAYFAREIRKTADLLGSGQDTACSTRIGHSMP